MKCEGVSAGRTGRHNEFTHDVPVKQKTFETLGRLRFYHIKNKSSRSISKKTKQTKNQRTADAW